MNGQLSLQLVHFSRVCMQEKIQWLIPAETTAESDFQEAVSNGACVDN